MPDQPTASNGFDAYSPVEVAGRVESVGVTKANMPLYRMAALSVLAGAFIGLGGLFFLTVTTGVTAGFGMTQLLGGTVFSLGLILVVVGGAELFTGNNLLIMAFVSRKIPFWLLLRNWAIVFLGNLVGAVSVAVLAYWAEHWGLANQGVGARVLAVGVAKVSLPFGVALTRAILCNVLVCLAVWLAFAARTVTDKVLAILFPISAFVAMGFEHSVANMMFIPYAILVKGSSAVPASSLFSAESLAALDWAGLVRNLIPVTLGNMIGGVVLVGVTYWFCYLWDGHTSPGHRRNAA